MDLFRLNNRECYIHNSCLSNAMHSVGKCIKSPECPCVRASVRPTFLKLFSFHLPLPFLFSFPFSPIPFFFPFPFLFPFPLPLFLPLPFCLSLLLPLSFTVPFPFPSPFSFSSPSRTLHLFLPFSLIFSLPLSLFSLSLSVFLPSTHFLTFLSPSLPFLLPLSFSLSFPSPFLFFFSFFHFSFHVHVHASNIWGAVSPYRCKIDAWLHHGPPIGSRPPRVKWPRDWWRYVTLTPKGQGRDPIIFEALYLHNGAR